MIMVVCVWWDDMWLWCVCVCKYIHKHTLSHTGLQLFGTSQPPPTAKTPTTDAPPTESIPTPTVTFALPTTTTGAKKDDVAGTKVCCAYIGVHLICFICNLCQR